MVLFNGISIFSFPVTDTSLELINRACIAETDLKMQTSCEKGVLIVKMHVNYYQVTEEAGRADVVGPN